MVAKLDIKSAVIRERAEISLNLMKAATLSVNRSERFYLAVIVEVRIRSFSFTFPILVTSRAL